MRDRLPEQYQNLPDDVLMTGLVDQLVDQDAARRDAVAVARDRPAAGAAHLDNERRGALAGHRRQCDGGRRRRRREGAGGLRRRRSPRSSRSPSSAPRTSSSTSEEKAKALKAEIDGGADFAELAKANSTDRLGAVGRRPRLVRPGADGAGVRDGGLRHGGRRRLGAGADPVRLAPDQARTRRARRRRRRSSRLAPRSRTSCARQALEAELAELPRRGDDREARDRHAARGDPRERPADQLRPPVAGKPAAGLAARAGSLPAPPGHRRRALRRRRGRGALRRAAST